VPPAPSRAVTADEVERALEGAYGVHPGQRRNHTKGTCALGSFVGSQAGARYSRSLLFSGRTLPVTVRFSLAGGNPRAADTEKSPRGMALEFELPDGSLHHMTMIDAPMFFARTPRTFLDKMLAIEPDPATGKPDPAKLEAFADRHPDALAQTHFFAENNPPRSYTESSYFGIHTFRFVDRAGKTTPVRFRFVPEDGEKRLTDAELTQMPADFLEPALLERVGRGPARWTMILTIGEPGDPENDPTLLFPENRTEVEVGTLTIGSAMKQAGAACETINYDPLVMSDGVEPTDDPVLLFRSPSYAASFRQRRQGK
jgi:catalase